jgi:hypothetical protein
MGIYKKKSQISKNPAGSIGSVQELRSLVQWSVQIFPSWKCYINFCKVTFLNIFEHFGITAAQHFTKFCLSTKAAKCTHPFHLWALNPQPALRGFESQSYTHTPRNKQHLQKHRQPCENRPPREKVEFMSHYGYLVLQGMLFNVPIIFELIYKI